MRLLKALAEAFGSYLRSVTEGLEQAGALQRQYIELEAALYRRVGTKAKMYEHQRQYAFEAAFYCAKQGLTLDQLRAHNKEQNNDR